ncbi:MAG: hypothetical protein WCH11_07270, partial [Bdellovibrio sp.]
GIPPQVFHQGPGDNWNLAVPGAASASASVAKVSAQGLLALWPELKRSCEMGSSNLTPRRGPPSSSEPGSR